MKCLCSETLYQWIPVACRGGESVGRGLLPSVLFGDYLERMFPILRYRARSWRDLCSDPRRFFCEIWEKQESRDSKSEIVFQCAMLYIQPSTTEVTDPISDCILKSCANIPTLGKCHIGIWTILGLSRQLKICGMVSQSYAPWTPINISGRVKHAFISLGEKKCAEPFLLKPVGL